MASNLFSSGGGFTSVARSGDSLAFSGSASGSARVSNIYRLVGPVGTAPGNVTLSNISGARVHFVESLSGDITIAANADVRHGASFMLDLNDVSQTTTVRLADNAGSEFAGGDIDFTIPAHNAVLFSCFLEQPSSPQGPSNKLIYYVDPFSTSITHDLRGGGYITAPADVVFPNASGDPVVVPLAITEWGGTGASNTATLRWVAADHHFRNAAGRRGRVNGTYHATVTNGNVVGDFVLEARRGTTVIGGSNASHSFTAANQSANLSLSFNSNISPTDTIDFAGTLSVAGTISVTQFNVILSTS